MAMPSALQPQFQPYAPPVLRTAPTPPRFNAAVAAGNELFQSVSNSHRMQHNADEMGQKITSVINSMVQGQAGSYRGKQNAPGFAFSKVTNWRDGEGDDKGARGTTWAPAAPGKTLGKAPPNPLPRVVAPAPASLARDFVPGVPQAAPVGYEGCGRIIFWVLVAVALLVGIGFLCKNGVAKQNPTSTE